MERWNEWTTWTHGIPMPCVKVVCKITLLVLTLHACVPPHVVHYRNYITKWTELQLTI